MPAFKDLTCQKFKRLTVVSLNKRERGAYWNCKCDCGNEVVVTAPRLLSGNTKSCGCLKLEKLKTGSITHNMRHTVEYETWARMKGRCFNQNDSRYDDYGGRGITVYPEWVESFEAFYRDLGPRPSPSHSLERRDNSLGYEPGNCCWATRIEQANNKRNVKLFTVNGKTASLAELARDAGLDYWKVRRRIGLGWTINQALGLIPRKRA